MAAGHSQIQGSVRWGTLTAPQKPARKWTSGLGAFGDWALSAQKWSNTPFRFPQSDGEQPRGSSDVALACAQTHRCTYFTVLGGWAHSPPLGPESGKSTHMVDKNTQSHSCPRTHTHTRVHLHTLPSVFLRYTSAYGTTRFVFFRHSHTMNLSYTQIWLASGQDALLWASYVRISRDIYIHRGHTHPTTAHSPYTLLPVTSQS